MSGVVNVLAAEVPRHKVHLNVRPLRMIEFNLLNSNFMGSRFVAIELLASEHLD